ncbi:MAG: SulP family inorganic anion transporter [Myxococcota bacterium]
MEPVVPWRKRLQHDLPASVVVFLVAVPLCLGIALASGAPPVAGIVTGIIGGIVVGMLSGSHTSVSGPAAGLTVIVLQGIDALGTFQAFLAAVFVSGLLQILFGLLRGGRLVHYVPAAVIRGMLAGIGLIIIVTQIPHLLGLTAVRDQLSFSRPSLLMEAEVWGMVLGLGSLALLFVAERIDFIRKRPYLPGPLLAVVVAAALDGLVGLVRPGMSLSADLRVDMPNLADGGGGVVGLHLPDLAVFIDPTVLWTALVIALVGSIETLLCVEAVDRQDPLRRSSPMNRELFAQGVGNTLCGLVGGLPMTAVIVRGSTNVQAGSRTKLSAISHGILLLVAALAIPGLLSLIPLAALAAVLVFVGLRLAAPVFRRSTYRSPALETVPFLVTTALVLVLGLLWGVLTGLAVGYAMRLRYRSSRPVEVHRDGSEGAIRVVMAEAVAFFHKPRVRKALLAVPSGGTVEIDASSARHIDQEVIDEIRSFARDAVHRDVNVRLKGLSAEAR